MTNGVILALFLFILLKLHKLTKGGFNTLKAENKGRGNKEADTLERLTDGMTEYSREISYELGFNRHGKKFKRPQVLKRKELTAEEESYLERGNMLDIKFAEVMKTLIPLRLLHTKEAFKNKTIRVFIDTMNDTKVIARDDSAMLEIDLKTVYCGIAGEFVLINLDKDGEDLRINYILAEGSKTDKLN